MLYCFSLSFLDSSFHPFIALKTHAYALDLPFTFESFILQANVHAILFDSHTEPTFRPHFFIFTLIFIKLSLPSDL